MSDQVDNTERQQGWPRDRFHPVYESFTDWLNAEAPVDDQQQRKARNQPAYRRGKRGNAP